MAKRQSVRREDRWTEADARRRLEEWRASGQRLVDYTRESGESRDRLQWWKRKLGISGPAGRGAVHISPRASASATVPVVERTATPPACGFVEIQRMTPDPEPPVLAGPGPRPVRAGLELRVRGGYRLRIATDFDAPTLKRVLDVLGEVG